MAVVSMIVGATTPTGASFVAKVDGGGPVRVAVADNPSMDSPVFTSSVNVNSQGVAKLSITGLEPFTRYWWQVEDNGNLDTNLLGRFRTHPPLGLPATFSFAVASCAGSAPAVPGVGDVLASNRLSNHPVFLDIQAQDPLWFSHLGDMAYYDPGSGVVGDESLATYRRMYDDVLLQPNQHRLYRSVALQYVWDDHDFGPNNSDKTHPGRANAQQVYRERFPHYPLPDSEGIFQAWQVGRVQFVAWDSRSYKDPNADPDTSSKSLLGAPQKQWLENVLATSTASFLVVLSPVCWINAPGVDDTFEVYTAERAELVSMFGDYGWLNRMMMAWGDRHAMGIDTGSHVPGSFPVGQFAPLDDSTPAGGATWFDTGPESSQPGQYGLITIADTGSAISVDMSGYVGSSLWRTHRFSVGADSPVFVAPGALLRTISGSHQPIIEARVVSSFQTGDNPDGVPLKLRAGSGHVTYDGTADAAEMEIVVPGVDEDNYFPEFPRRPNHLLAPYGNEIFIRYGVDLGGAGVIWTPLGYFRIETVEQSDSPYGDLVIKGRDRMAGLVEATLLEPRTYDETDTYGFVAADLITRVYPQAVVLWDDDTHTEPIGRVVLVEEDGYAALRELADSAGKLFSVDDTGVFRFYSPPDDSEPVWTVNAQRDGVLVSAERQVTRDGVYNAVIVTGQGPDDLPPVRAVAIDKNPNSPTYYFGRFGKVPRKYESPLLTTSEAVESAGVNVLRRSLGAQYRISFTSAANPTLRPWQVVQIATPAGRELHTMQRVTIQLGRSAMTGSSRERRIINVGGLN